MSEIILRDIYKNIKNIAVIGISPKEDRPSNKVSLELQKRAYKIIPINPNSLGVSILAKIIPTRKVIPEPAILSTKLQLTPLIVLVFRDSDMF